MYFLPSATIVEEGKEEGFLLLEQYGGLQTVTFAEVTPGTTEEADQALIIR